MIDLIKKAYNTYCLCCSSWLQSLFLLAVRLYWGWHFMETGFGKLTNLDRTANFFAGLNIPFPKINALMAGSTECFGGFLLLIGLFSRLISLPLCFVMIVAYLTAEFSAVQQIFSDPDKFVSATPFTFLLASLIVLVFGPGKFSADHIFHIGEPKKSQD